MVSMPWYQRLMNAAMNTAAVKVPSHSNNSPFQIATAVIAVKVGNTINISLGQVSNPFGGFSK
tara:strand:- start:1749 stop:1937 length:189 start_codon:yes stop_codon:yes gene_type:complete